MERVGLVVTDTHVKPAELDAAITRVADTRRPLSIEVVIPVELPPTLPISAVPPRVAARAHALLVHARAALEAARCPARAEIVACRSVGALLRDLPPLERLILVGATAWSVRRAARGVAADVSVLSSRSVPAGRRRKPRVNAGEVVVAP